MLAKTSEVLLKGSDKVGKSASTYKKDDAVYKEGTPAMKKVATSRSSFYQDGCSSCPLYQKALDWATRQDQAALVSHSPASAPLPVHVLPERQLELLTRSYLEASFN